jgi:AcrR family transcriptional regulator
MAVSSGRTQVERTAATRAALVATGRRLFGSEGFAEVGTERLAREAGVSRGALYHQFADKTELFAAVLDRAEREITDLMAGAVANQDPANTVEMLLAGADAWLDACAQPGLQRIVLLDGPSVLGWERWREICLHHSVGLVAALLTDGIERGTIPPQPVDPLTHVLVGAVDEAALYVARAANPITARADITIVLRRLATAITTP